jgi:tetratricopeptide (TPR) repeat protein
LLLEHGRGLTALGLLWVPVTVLPVANLLVPIGVLLAERTLYFPSAALSIGAAGLFAWLRVAKPALLRPAAFAGVAVLALFAVRITTRIPDWSSTDEILMAQLRDRPDTFRAEWHAARMAKRDRQPRAALGHYARALRLWPWRERMVVEAAAYASQQRDVRFALQLAQHGVNRWPQNVELQRLLAANALDSGDTATARVALSAGLKLAPKDTLLNQMATALSSRKALR